MNAFRGTVYLVGQSSEVQTAMSATLDEAGFTVATCLDRLALARSINPERAGCVVLALRAIGTDDDERCGLVLLDELNRSRIGTPVVMTSDGCEVPTAVAAMRRGASDFLLLPIEPQRLVERIGEAVARDAERIAEQAEARGIYGRLVRLTPRQRQLLDCVITGMSNKQIAAEWKVSERTVANHRANLLSRMRAVNTADLVRMAMEARQHDLS